jgi:hypothetical protein
LSLSSGDRRRRSAGDIDPAQRFHEIDDVLPARPLSGHDRFAGALLVDELDEGCFVLFLELVGANRAYFMRWAQVPRM